jgi:hypothetical protein
VHTVRTSPGAMEPLHTSNAENNSSGGTSETREP